MEASGGSARFLVAKMQSRGGEGGEGDGGHEDEEERMRRRRSQRGMLKWEGM